MSKFRVGLVGFGMVAQRFHAPLLEVSQDFSLTHVVERRGARSQELYPHVKVVTSHQALLAEPVDVVVVVTPNASHFPIARDALNAGKHVVLDKPMTVTSQEADVLLDLARNKGLTLTVFQNRRWDNDLLTLKKLLVQRSLGALVELESRFDRYRPQLKGGWREEDVPGAGILYDLGSHLLDQAVFLFGLPSAVLATLLKERPQARVDDGFRISLQYGGFFVHLGSSCMAAEPKLRFRVRGDKGAWVKHGLDPQEAGLARAETPGTPGWGEEGSEQWGRLYRGDRDEGEPFASVPGDYPAFYRLLSRSLRFDEPPPVSAMEARNTIRLIELCLESHANRRWVPWTDCDEP